MGLIYLIPVYFRVSCQCANMLKLWVKKSDSYNVQSENESKKRKHDEEVSQDKQYDASKRFSLRGNKITSG